MSNIQQQTAGTDSKAAEVASVLFSEDARQFPRAAKMLTEWMLDGKISVDAVRTALAACMADLHLATSKPPKNEQNTAASMSAAVTKLNG